MTATLSEELVWSQIVAKSWCDDDFMNRLLSDPRAGARRTRTGDCLRVGGRNRPRRPTLKVNGTATVRRFVMPPKPLHETTDDELVGDVWAYCYCAACTRSWRLRPPLPLLGTLGNQCTFSQFV